MDSTVTYGRRQPSATCAYPPQTPGDLSSIIQCSSHPTQTVGRPEEGVSGLLIAHRARSYRCFYEYNYVGTLNSWRIEKLGRAARTDALRVTFQGRYSFRSSCWELENSCCFSTYGVIRSVVLESFPHQPVACTQTALYSSLSIGRHKLHRGH